MFPYAVWESTVKALERFYAVCTIEKTCLLLSPCFLLCRWITKYHHLIYALKFSICVTTDWLQTIMEERKFSPPEMGKIQLYTWSRGSVAHHPQVDVPLPGMADGVPGWTCTVAKSLWSIQIALLQGFQPFSLLPWRRGFELDCCRPGQQARRLWIKDIKGRVSPCL